MISILIVNWNTRELLRACLASLALIEVEHEIIVVDNASRDGSAAMVAREFPFVKVFSFAHNPGFAVGNNCAYGVARGQWIWLLNPDTEVQQRAARVLVEFLENNPRVGAVASALVDARDGHIQRSCRTFPTPAALWAQAAGLARLFPRSRRFGFYKMGWWNYRTARAVEQPMASSLMLRRAAIEAIGPLFDADFPIFFNDVDLCWRLWRAGWEIWFEPRARVKHWGGAATNLVKPQMIAESHRSLRRFYLKHYRGQVAAPLFWATLWMSELAGRARLWRAKKRPPQK